MQPPTLQDKKDSDHLRILAVCHFVFAAIALLGIGFLFFHYQMMGLFFNNPAIAKEQAGAPFSPDEFLEFFVWLYIAGAVLMVISSLLNLLSGLGLLKRRYRTLTFVTAGLNCLSVPLGTTLGIFTFIVLSRDSVRRLYEDQVAVEHKN